MDIHVQTHPAKVSVPGEARIRIAMPPNRRKRIWAQFRTRSASLGRGAHDCSHVPNIYRPHGGDLLSPARSFRAWPISQARRLSDPPSIPSPTKASTRPATTAQSPTRPAGAAQPPPVAPRDPPAVCSPGLPTGAAAPDSRRTIEAHPDFLDHRGRERRGLKRPAGTIFRRFGRSPRGD